jgi:succinoglycan biosynthesis transport protein ExoP
MKLMREQPEQQYRRRASDKAQLYAPGASRQGAAGSEQPVFRLDVMRGLQLHRKLAAGIILAGFLGAAAYLLSLWPLYTARSVVYVQPAPQRVMDQTASRWPFDTNTNESYIAQQMESATRYDVLTNALHKLDPGTFQHRSESDQAAAERLGRAIEVKRLGSSYEISIAARASSATVAARLSNAVAASYIESAAREGRSGDTQRLTMLHEEEERVKKELTADRSEQHDLNKTLGVAGVGTNTPDLLDEDLSRVRSELINARSASDSAAARLTSMDANRTHSTAALDAEADQMLAVDTGLGSMRATLFQRRATLTSQMANLTTNHPQYKQDAQELAQINSSLESMTKDLREKASARIQQRLRTELERTSGEELRLNARLGQMASASSGMTPKMQRENDLAADIIRLQNRYSSVDEQLHNLMLDAGAPATSYLAAAAVPPLSPTKSGVLRNTMVIAFAGLLLGIIAAVTANKLDQKIYIAADVEQVLGFAPMAALPDFAQVSEDVAEEHMLRLSAGIDHARQHGNLKSCIFTGTGPGTGVTTMASRVRTTLEALGRATVLVDASGVQPMPARGATGAFGLNDASSQLATQPGTRSGARSGIRSTAVLQQLAEEMGGEDESLVLTDTAPLAVSAETEYLARFVDAAIVVIQSGVTTRTQLREAASTLQRLEVTAVGFVLNRVGLEKADAGFRRSVRGIEQHLRAQNRSAARGTERSSPAAPAESIKAEQAPDYSSADARVEPQADKPIVVTEAAVHPPVLPIPELPATLPESSPLPAHATRIPGIELATAEAPRSEQVLRPERKPAAEPASMSSGLSEAQPAPPDKSWLSSPPQPLLRGRAPQVAATTPPANASEAQAAAGSLLPTPALPHDVAPAPSPATPLKQHHSPQPPAAQSWERAVGRFYKDTDVAQSVMEAPQPEPAETPDNAATRMTGLRNLIISLGMKNLNNPADDEEQIAQETPFTGPMRDRDRQAYEPVYPEQDYAPLTQNFARREPVAATSTLFTAPPEILPPKTTSGSADSDQSRKGSTSDRRDRRDSYDDVEILPSWHGQYKKK